MNFTEYLHFLHICEIYDISDYFEHSNVKQNLVKDKMAQVIFTMYNGMIPMYKVFKW